MQAGQLATLRVDLAPSRGWAAIVGMLHAVALMVLAVSGAPASVIVAAAVVIISHAVFRIRRDALLATPRAIVALELASGRVCTLVARDGSRITGRIGDATRVTGWLVVIGIRVRPWSRTIAIVPGMAASATVRELRVRLRWDTAPAA